MAFENPWNGPQASASHPVAAHAVHEPAIDLPYIPAKVNHSVATQLFGNYADDTEHHSPQSNESDIYTGLGAEVDQLVAKSPTLRNQMKMLERLRWTIKYAGKGGATETDYKDRIITVDPSEKGNALLLLQSLSHEVGHALFARPPELQLQGVTRQQYIDHNVTSLLLNEGHATINSMLVRAELLAAKQGDIGVAGAQAEKYLELFQKYPDVKDRKNFVKRLRKYTLMVNSPTTTRRATTMSTIRTAMVDAGIKLFRRRTHDEDPSLSPAVP